MTLINVWTRDFTQRITRAVATIEHQQRTIPMSTSLDGIILRPPETTDTIIITATNLTEAFREKLVIGLANGVFTVEDEPDFAFVTAEIEWHETTLTATALPLITHLRRNSLPDWYVPDERFC